MVVARCSGHQRHLGSYDTAEEAARSFDRATIRLRGPDEELNFPYEEYKNDNFLNNHAKVDKFKFLDLLREQFAIPTSSTAVSAKKGAKNGRGKGRGKTNAQSRKGKLMKMIPDGLNYEDATSIESAENLTIYNEGLMQSFQIDIAAGSAGARGSSSVFPYRESITSEYIGYHIGTHQLNHGERNSSIFDVSAEPHFSSSTAFEPNLKMCAGALHRHAGYANMTHPHGTYKLAAHSVTSLGEPISPEAITAANFESATYSTRNTSDDTKATCENRFTVGVPYTITSNLGGSSTGMIFSDRGDETLNDFISSHIDAHSPNLIFTDAFGDSHIGL